MSKELTPLQALEKIKQAHYFVDFELDAKVSEDYKKELGIIENALKDYEELDKVAQSYANEIARLTLEMSNNGKKLKALEIIKEKEVLSVYKDFKGTCYLFVNTMGIEITETEYDLLREVLL